MAGALLLVPGLASMSGAGGSGQRADDGGADQGQQRPECRTVGLDQANDDQCHAGNRAADQQHAAIEAQAFPGGA